MRRRRGLARRHRFRIRVNRGFDEFDGREQSSASSDACSTQKWQFCASAAKGVSLIRVLSRRLTVDDPTSLVDGAAGLGHRPMAPPLLGKRTATQLLVAVGSGKRRWLAMQRRHLDPGDVCHWHHPGKGADRSRVCLAVLTGSFQTLGPLKSRTRTNLAGAQ
jgi:hypothetical protein